VVLSQGWPSYNGKAFGNRATTSNAPPIPDHSAFIVFHCVSDRRPINFNTADQPDSAPALTDNCCTVANQDAYTNHTCRHSESDRNTIADCPISTDSGKVHIVTYRSNSHSHSFANSDEYSHWTYPFANSDEYSRWTYPFTNSDEYSHRNRLHCHRMG